MDKKLYSTVKFPLKTDIAFKLKLFGLNKNPKSKVLKLGINGNKIRKLTFFLPNEQKYIPPIIQYFKRMNKTKLMVKLICKSTSMEIYHSSINHSGMIISDKHLNRWGLAERSTVNQIESIIPDAVIDLNPKYDPLHLALIHNMKCQIKIGFNSKWAHRIFTVLLHGENQEFKDNQFDQINQLIGLA